MASPEGYFDDRTDYDPPPRNSPRLVADVARLAGLRRTADRRPSSSRGRDAHRFHRKLIIFLAVRTGLTHEQVADAMHLSRARVTNIVAEMQAIGERWLRDD